MGFIFALVRAIIFVLSLSLSLYLLLTGPESAVQLRGWDGKRDIFFENSVI